MRPRKTKDATFCLELVDGNEDNYLYIEPTVDTTGTPVMISYWEPDAAELEKLVAGERVALIVTGRVHPPVAMVVGDPHA